MGWELDKPARSRRAPDVFASSQTETLFFSLIGATKAAFGDDHCGGWLMQVMGEYVRQTYETVGQQIRDQGESGCYIRLRVGRFKLTVTYTLILRRGPCRVSSGRPPDRNHGQGHPAVGIRLPRHQSPTTQRAVDRLPVIPFLPRRSHSLCTEDL